MSSFHVSTATVTRASTVYAGKSQSLDMDSVNSSLCDVSKSDTMDIKYLQSNTININKPFSALDISDISKNENTVNGQTYTAQETSLTEISKTSEKSENLILNDITEGTLGTSLHTSLSEETELNKDSTIFDNEMEIDNGLDGERWFFENSLVELARRMWKSNKNEQHYTKGCVWSPDGSCILVPVHLDGMHIVELPTEFYQTVRVSSKQGIRNLETAVHVKEGGTVYDYAWYPFMNSSTPETCCWIASRQHEPIHMWDAFTGDLRCTYRGYDEVDEVTSAISVIFSKDGQKVIGGYKKSLKVFDTNIPGRDCTSMPIKHPVSCFALNSSNPDVIAAGSWNGIIHLYDMRVPELGSLFAFGGHTGGITYLQYSKDGEMLFSGARKDNDLFEWDMRNYLKPYRIFRRKVATNQRIYFDLSPQNEWLLSGDTDGFLRIWDLTNQYRDIELPLHKDCCNGASFHPTRPILATSSGQYHFQKAEDDDMELENVIEYENALIFWWLGDNDLEKE